MQQTETPRKRSIPYLLKGIQFHWEDFEGVPALQACVDLVTAMPDLMQGWLDRIIVIEKPANGSWETRLRQMTKVLTG